MMIEGNEDEMIDVAEKIFVRIADEIIKKQVTVRAVWNRFISIAMIDGEEYELIEPQDLVEGMKDLGITDLNQLEQNYLLKVLQKPELDNAILMQEFLQIMENFGLYDDQEQAQMQQYPSDNSGSSPQQRKAKGEGKPLDLGLLDQKSVKVMVMLMLFLLENNMTAAEFFEPAIYQQNVKSKNK